LYIRVLFYQIFASNLFKPPTFRLQSIYWFYQYLSKCLHWWHSPILMYRVLLNHPPNYGQPSYPRSLLSFPSHRCTRSSSLITLSQHSITSRLKIANRSFYYSTPVWQNNLPSHLRHVVHHVTSTISNSPVSDLSTSFFLKKLKTHLFHFSFPA